MAIEHADFEGVERLALVTGGEIASTFDMPESVKLGRCELIEEVIIGEDKLLKFSGGSLVLRGICAVYVRCLPIVVLSKNYHKTLFCTLSN